MAGEFPYQVSPGDQGTMTVQAPGQGDVSYSEALPQAAPAAPPVGGVGGMRPGDVVGPTWQHVYPQLGVGYSNRVNAQGRIETMLDQSPWGQGDERTLSLLQNSFGKVSSDQNLAPEHKAAVMEQLGGRIQHMKGRQQRWQQNQQQQLTQQFMQQAALKATTESVRDQTLAKDLPKMVGTVVNPDTGEVEHYLPKQTAHGMEWVPLTFEAHDRREQRRIDSLKKGIGPGPLTPERISQIRDWAMREAERTTPYPVAGHYHQRELEHALRNREYQKAAAASRLEDMVFKAHQQEQANVNVLGHQQHAAEVRSQQFKQRQESVKAAQEQGKRILEHMDAHAKTVMSEIKADPAWAGKSHQERRAYAEKTALERSRELYPEYWDARDRRLASGQPTETPSTPEQALENIAKRFTAPHAAGSQAVAPAPAAPAAPAAPTVPPAPPPAPPTPRQIAESRFTAGELFDMKKYGVDPTWHNNRETALASLQQQKRQSIRLLTLLRKRPDLTAVERKELEILNTAQRRKTMGL